jgi:hypothetical protein
MTFTRTQPGIYHIWNGKRHAGVMNMRSHGWWEVTVWVDGYGYRSGDAQNLYCAKALVKELCAA